MKPETSLFHAVEQLAHILEKDPTKTLIKVAYDNDLIENALMNSCIKDRVSLIQIQRAGGGGSVIRGNKIEQNNTYTMCFNFKTMKKYLHDKNYKKIIFYLFF
jgi:hypothetical protein